MIYRTIASIRLGERRRVRGFTLVELLVVLAIIAIVAGVLAPYARGSSAAMRLQDAALTLATHVRYAEALAIQSEQTARLRIDTRRQGYSVEIAEDVARGTYVVAPGMGREFIPLPDGVVFVDAGGKSGINGDELVFDPDGDWSVGDLALSNGASTINIRISRSLGDVRVVAAKP